MQEELPLLHPSVPLPLYIHIHIRMLLSQATVAYPSLNREAVFFFFFSLALTRAQDLRQRLLCLAKLKGLDCFLMENESSLVEVSVMQLTNIKMCKWFR